MTERQRGIELRKSFAASVGLDETDLAHPLCQVTAGKFFLSANVSVRSE